MASLHGNPSRSNSREGLQVVPQAPHPPDLDHLIVTDDSEKNGRMPPLEMYVSSQL